MVEFNHTSDALHERWDAVDDNGESTGWVILCYEEGGPFFVHSLGLQSDKLEDADLIGDEFPSLTKAKQYILDSIEYAYSGVWPRQGTESL